MNCATTNESFLKLTPMVRLGNRTISVNLRKRLCFYEPLSIGMVIDIVGHLVP